MRPAATPPSSQPPAHEQAGPPRRRPHPETPLRPFALHASAAQEAAGYGSWRVCCYVTPRSDPPISTAPGSAPASAPTAIVPPPRRRQRVAVNAATTNVHSTQSPSRVRSSVRPPRPAPRHAERYRGHQPQPHPGCDGRRRGSGWVPPPRSTGNSAETGLAAPPPTRSPAITAAGNAWVVHIAARRLPAV